MKVDFKKELKTLYSAPSREFVVVDVPPMHFLMIDGKGDPNSSEVYANAVAALYAVAYGFKSMSKQELERDYGVPPLEGLWWAPDMGVFEADRIDSDLMNMQS